jgi:hypothetical protein
VPAQDLCFGVTGLLQEGSIDEGEASLQVGDGDRLARALHGLGQQLQLSLRAFAFGNVALDREHRRAALVGHTDADGLHVHDGPVEPQ